MKGREKKKGEFRVYRCYASEQVYKTEGKMSEIEKSNLQVDYGQKKIDATYFAAAYPLSSHAKKQSARFILSNYS